MSAQQLLAPQMHRSPETLQLRCAVYHGHKRLLEIFNHISLSVSHEFHTPETFPALFGSRGLQLQSNVFHVLVWSVCEVGVLVLAARRWTNGRSVAVHAAGAIALPILFLKRRGPHNWYLALTTETSSVVAISLAAAFSSFMSPPGSSAPASVVRVLAISAALAAPLGGWEIILASALGMLAENGFARCAGRDHNWSARHFASIVGAVPVGIAALALQEMLMARILRSSPLDLAHARLPSRLQHTLQLLFNGAFSSAADVRSPRPRVTLYSRFLVLPQVVGTFCIRPRANTRPYGGLVWWRWLPLVSIDSSSLYVPHSDTLRLVLLPVASDASSPQFNSA